MEEFWMALLRMGLATVSGAMIGWERGRKGSAAGLRTHLLVCVGGALTAMVSVFVQKYVADGDVFRISAQVVSGIGFLGAGMIFSRERGIQGLTSAAAIWVTAIIGIAWGYGYYVGAGIAFAVCIIATALLTTLERSFKTASRLYVELSDPRKAQDVTEAVNGFLGHKLMPEIAAAKSSMPGHISLSYNIVGKFDEKALQTLLEAQEGVFFVMLD